MRLDAPFYRLSLRFGADRMREEVARLDPTAWIAHPSGFPGNSAVPLITVGGELNDDFAISGPMQPTSHLKACPYLVQVLASLGAPLSRSRLMRLEPGAAVPPHRDRSYHWYRRVRVHIPIQTHPDVWFICDGTRVHMRAGEAWIFDNFLTHSVKNDSPRPRIHLVADLRPTPAFWHWVAGDSEPESIADNPVGRLRLPLEPHRFEVLTPGEMEVLTKAIVDAAREASVPNHALVSLDDEVRRLRRAWSNAFKEHGDSRSGEWRYFCLLQRFLDRVPRRLKRMRSDDSAGADALGVLATMLVSTNRTASYGSDRIQDGVSTDSVTSLLPLQRSTGDRAHGFHLSSQLERLTEHFEEARTPEEAWGRIRDSPGPHPSRAEFENDVTMLERMGVLQPRCRPPDFEAPIFIVSAPRSGSSLLFETWAQAPEIWSLGGESHHLIEAIPALHPRERGYASNRLEREDATPTVARALRERIALHLRDRDGRRFAEVHEWVRPRAVRFLEKTPKNALRIPFLGALFPDARFVYLYRDPQDSISSIMEGWRSGRFVTYSSLPGWEATSWSFLLPPGWQGLRPKSFADVAAFQWAQTNEIILEDLSRLPAWRWTSLSYAGLCSAPEQTLRRLCEFAALRWDARLQHRVSQPLPMSRATLSAPSPGKWQKNRDVVESVLSDVEPVWRRIRQEVMSSPHAQG